MQPNADLDKDKKLQRAERFDLAVPEREQAKKQKRAARFGSASDGDKLTSRAAQSATNALKGTTAAPKMAIAADPEEDARRKVRRAVTTMWAAV